jgi:hypothetical protein
LWCQSSKKKNKQFITDMYLSVQNVNTKRLIWRKKKVSGRKLLATSIEYSPKVQYFCLDHFWLCVLLLSVCATIVVLDITGPGSANVCAVEFKYTRPTPWDLYQYTFFDRQMFAITNRVCNVAEQIRLQCIWNQWQKAKLHRSPVQNLTPYDVRIFQRYN